MTCRQLVIRPVFVAVAVRTGPWSRAGFEVQPFVWFALIRVRAEALILLRHLLNNPDQEFYGAQISDRTGINNGSISTRLRQLEQVGWLTARLEDDDSWRQRATPGRGPGRRITYYALTPEGQKAAVHEVRKRASTPTAPTADNSLGQPPIPAGQGTVSRSALVAGFELSASGHPARQPAELETGRPPDAPSQRLLGAPPALPCVPVPHPLQEAARRRQDELVK